jgi:hypothetical protein
MATALGQAKQILAVKRGVYYPLGEYFVTIIENLQRHAAAALADDDTLSINEMNAMVDAWEISAHGAKEIASNVSDHAPTKLRTKLVKLSDALYEVSEMLESNKVGIALRKAVKIAEANEQAFNEAEIEISSLRSYSRRGRTHAQVSGTVRAGNKAWKFMSEGK